MYLRLIWKTSRYALKLAGGLALIVMLSACGKEATVKEDNFPELTLKGMDGSQFSTGAFRGKLLVFNVWATWCPPCRREMPSLERLSKNVDSNHIVVAGISVDTDENLAREFLDQNGITFRNFIDADGKITEALSISIYPETLLIDPGGKVVDRIKGERDWNDPAIRLALEDIYYGKRRRLDDSLSGSAASSPEIQPNPLK